MQAVDFYPGAQPTHDSRGRRYVNDGKRRSVGRHLEETLPSPCPPGKYRTICADPPWEYESFVSLWPSGKKKAKRSLPYESMSLWEIGALPVGDFAEPDGCNLFLWTTNRYLPHAFPLLAYWGFEYRQTLTWAKPNAAPWSGSVAPNSTEFLLLACRSGGAGFVGRVRNSVITSRRLEHSAKPEAFIDLVETVSPGPYL